MLGKLLKYELLAEMRKYVVVFAAIIGAAVLFLLFDRGLSRLGDYAIIDIFSGLLLIAFILLCFFTLAMIIVMSCVRFRKIFSVTRAILCIRCPFLHGSILQ